MSGLPASLLIHTVTRQRPSTSTDAYGNTVRTYPGSTASVTGRVEQNKATEPLSEGRNAQVREWTLFTNESDIVTYDRIVFGSLAFDVDAPPAPTYDGTGFHHLEVALRKVDG